jgi:hypothetical protein
MLYNGKWYIFQRSLRIGVADFIVHKVLRCQLVVASDEAYIMTNAEADKQ